jgi:hypothetical protein
VKSQPGLLTGFVIMRSVCEREQLAGFGRIR